MADISHFSVRSAVLRGAEAVPVEVEAAVGGTGIPGLQLGGQLDAVALEGRYRVRSAIVQAGFSLPRVPIFVNVAPADVRKTGAQLDLPIAAAILAATGQIPPDGLEGALLVGELGLVGSVRPVRGVAAYEALASRAGATLVAAQKSGVLGAPGARGISSLGDLRRGVAALPPLDPTAGKRPAADEGPDFADVVGQEPAKRACLIAAAGGHNLLLVGPDGAGKSMLARRLPTILPPMTFEERDRIATAHSVAGLPTEGVMCGIRPFRAPHHSISVAALVGGGRPVVPGEACLADGGVLYLDDIQEFSRSSLQSLESPARDGSVTLVRADGTYVMPSDFLLVASAPPCPCGHLGDPGHDCSDSVVQVAAYQTRLYGAALMLRVAVAVRVPRPSPADVLSAEPGMSSHDMRDLVMAARERAGFRESRLHGTRTFLTLKEALDFDAQAERCLWQAEERLGLGDREWRSCAAVARTVADLEGHGRVTADDVTRSISLRLHTPPDVGPRRTTSIEQGL